ncbi:MAG: hypothetical protein U0411_15625 [Thermodesulfovibrionales bacterium]
MEQKCSFDQIAILAAKDAGKATRIVATSFYKVLRKNGFTDEQIINVSSCILDCLLRSLKGYERKSSRKNGPDSLLGKREAGEPAEAVVRIAGRRTVSARRLSRKESIPA